MYAASLAGVFDARNPSPVQSPEDRKMTRATGARVAFMSVPMGCNSERQLTYQIIPEAMLRFESMKVAIARTTSCLAINSAGSRPTDSVPWWLKPLGEKN